MFAIGCAGSPQTRLLLDNPPALPQRIELSEVPFFPQQEYHCGPAALASIINYRGTEVVPDQIAKLIYVPQLKGSLQDEVVAAARQFDLLPVQLDGKMETLLRELAAGNPIFVLQNLGLDAVPVWHYEVVIGYDLIEANFILRSGLNRRITRRFDLFEKTWQRSGYWALTLVPANTVPPTASAASFLDAAIGLEQVGRIRSANIAYRSALRQWPDNLLAHTGLANSSYALGEYEAAENAYRAALKIDPEKAEVWNNLAYSLAQLGRHEAAQDAIRHALALDPDNDNFHSSLEELSRWQQ